MLNLVTDRAATSRPRARNHPPPLRGPGPERDHQRRRRQRTPGASAPSAAKRLDLQGLRALAVLLVVLNHANVPFVGGGYVGVDVFFVLSGYLITGILLREGFGRGDAAPGRISISGFYARRVRRILPAATLTIVVTSIAVFAIYDVARADFLQTKVVLLDALAASLFYVNIRLAATATNYFAQASTTMPSPFQHFWSLSVEEQFYFLWAPIVACAFFICRRGLTRRRFGVTDRDHDERLRRTGAVMLGVLIASLSLLSLGWSILQTAANPQPAYFSTAPRFWELGCGAGLALLVARTRVLPDMVREHLGWLGLAMIAVAAVLYSSHTPFPGSAALLPVAGSGLIILAGVAPTSAGVGRLLSTRPLPYIGDRSYTFYLWHAPALILAWQLTGRVLPVSTNLAVLTGAFMLSMFTYKFYENPLRFGRWLHGWRTAAIVPIALSMSAAAVVGPIALFEGSLAAQASASAQAHIAPLTAARGEPAPTNLWSSTPIPAVVAAATAARRDAPLPKAIVPSLNKLAQENSTGGSVIPRGCEPAFASGARGKICRLGDVRSKRVVVVLGDSHAGSWMPAMVQVARAQHFAVVPLDKPGCFVTRVRTNLPGWPCARWYQWALAQDRALHPAATLVMFLLAPRLQEHPASTVAHLQSVLSQVRNGVFLADPPEQDEQPTVCIPKSGANMGECSARVPSTYVPFMKAVSRMTTRRHYPAIPTLQWFCAAGTCPMVINNMLTTRDRSHMTTEYSDGLAPLLGAELTRVAPSAAPPATTRLSRSSAPRRPGSLRQ